MSETTRMTATTKQHARNLRRKMTDAEKLLWRHLRMVQLGGYKFRRQHPLGNYIADFVCLEAALVLEVDGGQHAESTANDAVRTHSFEAKGLHVMRFWNNEVLNNIEGVKLAIWNYLSGLQPPSPPFTREGYAGGCPAALPPPFRSPCQGEGVAMRSEDA